MSITIRREFQEFIEAKVKSGEYNSPDEVVEDALSRLKGEQELDDQAAVGASVASALAILPAEDFSDWERK